MVAAVITAGIALALSLILLVVGQSAAALWLGLLGVMGVVLISSVAQHLRELRVRDAMKGLQASIRDVERLTSRSEWRNAEAHRHLLELIRKHDPADQLAKIAGTFDEIRTAEAQRAELGRQEPPRGFTATQRDVEFILVSLLAQKGDRDG